MQSFIQKLRESISLPSQAKLVKQKDTKGLPDDDPGVKLAIDEGISWLCVAQDNSQPQDGGVARHYSLVNGWSASYPETTGYIIPTLFEYYKLSKFESIKVRAKVMTDWLVSIQFSEGGFPGGKIGDEPSIPVTFNTGQILFGLVSAHQHLGNYYEPAKAAADWLVDVQDEDGCWRKYESPFAASGDKVYDTHVSWALLEASQVLHDKRYLESGLAQVRWAITQQKNNGWFDKCCLDDALNPLTHTIGYALRGVLEAYKFSQDSEFLHAAIKCADPILNVLDKNGFLPGRLSSEWLPAANWVCLTGLSQLSYCWLMLYEFTHEMKYKRAGFLANEFVRKTMVVSEDLNISGGIKGSFPVHGDYGRFQFLNWAVKFMIDANIYEGKFKKLF